MRACVRVCVCVCVCVCACEYRCLTERQGLNDTNFPQWRVKYCFFNLCFDDSCRLDSCLGRRQLSSNQGELSENVALTKTVLFIELAASSRALENTLRAESMQWGSTDLAQITELDVMNCVTFNYACVYVFYWWRPAFLSLSSLRKVSRKLKTFNTVCCYCCFYLLQKLKIWVQSTVSYLTFSTAENNHCGYKTQGNAYLRKPVLKHTISVACWSTGEWQHK